MERYFLKPGREAELYRRFVGILMKLYCYYDLRVFTENDKEKFNPDPEELADWIIGCEDTVNIVVYADAEALICLDGGDAYMTVYDPSPSLLEKLGLLAASEGLFLRKP